MNKKIRRFFADIIPYMVVGVAIALLVALLFLVFHVALWGLLLGAILWVISLIVGIFKSKPETKKGTIIEHKKE